MAIPKKHVPKSRGPQNDPVGVASQPGENPVASLSAHIAVQRTFSGPMPPPEQLRQYNEVLPGAAERMLALVEKQQAHRHALETKTVDSDVRRTNQGMWMVLTVVILSPAAGTGSTLSDKPITGGIVAGGPFVALIWAFLHGTNVRQKEREARAATLAGR